MLFKKIIKWHKVFESVVAANTIVPRGRVLAMNVNNKNICIAHTTEGFFAINDKCPHNGASLGNGFCTAEGSIICPVHRYSFDLKTGRATSGGGEYAQTYPLEIREDGIYIGFETREWF